MGVEHRGPGGPRELRNAATPQRPINAQLRNSQNSRGRTEASISYLGVSVFLPWEFWALGLGRYLWSWELRSCGVDARSANPGAAPPSDRRVTRGPRE